MRNYIRLVYASTSTNPVTNNSGGVQKDVGTILMQARKNNSHDEIGGVLYFANNYFFQCLEGEQQAVDKLYRKIMKDQRHNLVKTLQVSYIKDREFNDWSMKYVLNDVTVMNTLNIDSIEEFNPYEFTDESINTLLGTFKKEPDSGEKSNTSENQNSGSIWSKLFGISRAA